MNFKYKLVKNPLTGEIDSITHNIDSGHKQSIPKCIGNKEYDKFIQDVKEHGIGIVEGPDIVTSDYKESRLNEYPDIGEQLDQLYWDLKNGRLDTGDWIQNITKIKLKHSKSNTGTKTIGELPQWVITEGTGNFP